MYAISLARIKPEPLGYEFYVPIVDISEIDMIVLGEVGKLVDYRDVAVNMLSPQTIIFFTQDGYNVVVTIRKVGEILPTVM